MDETTSRADDPVAAPIPAGLEAAGTRSASFEAVARTGELPLGAMLRVTRADLDVLLAHTERGIYVIEDRCPHMSAPFSGGALSGCMVDCPLHQGRFDLTTGDAVQFPTTGGLDADGVYHPPWAPPGAPPKPEPADAKARARATTRVRRLRYLPVRIHDGTIEVAFPQP